MSKIEWTNETWNPIIGCSKISEGCKNCYAEKMAYRLACMELSNHEHQYNYANVVGNGMNRGWNGKTHCQEHQLEKPLKRKKPTMYFVCSMGDLFHESVPFEWIDKVFDIMEDCPQHTFQVLTKRPIIMYEYMKRYGVGAMADNIWLGVTAENQEQANKRIPVLLQIPAKVRFVSVEPMLEEILFWNDWLEQPSYPSDRLKGIAYAVKYLAWAEWKCGIDWVICGGESGTNARPMHPDWVRNLKDQCESANVPFFFKQGSQNNWKNFKDFDYFPEDLKIRQIPKP